MSDSISDPYAVETDLESKQRGSEKFYQRKVDTKRVSKIISYVKSMILSQSAVDSMSLFPTALLLAAHWERNEEISCYESLDLGSFYGEINSLYVVDGQHRLYSLKQLYETVKDLRDTESLAIKEYLDNYTFNCMVLLNYDLWEQAKVFADVNFNQKSVNKSLYYSIFGMQENLATEDLKKSNIFIAHQLTRYMNSEPTSPLHRCIKMLGTGKGFISQAFFADSLIKNLRPLGIWHVENNYEQRNYSYMAIELMDFFSVVKNVFKDVWPTEDMQHRSIIAKTTGIGALLSTMAYLHECKLPDDLLVKMHNSYSKEEREMYKTLITKQLKKVYPYRLELFEMGGKYGSSGGKGQEAALRKEIQRIIEE